MTRTSVVLFALLLPSAVMAQEGLGLDLSDEQKKDDESKKDEAKKKEVTPETTPADKGLTATRKSDQPLPVERDTTAEDRVKSTQRKVYLKKHRFELAPFVSTAINDPFYSKLGISLRAAFYLADTLAIAARGSLYQVLPNSDVRIATSTFQSRIFHSVPNWSTMGDIEWSPIYGKAAMFNSILHFDAYILAGAGVVRTDTSVLPRRGPNVAGDLGIGMRFVAKDFLAVNLALINTTYADQPAGTTNSVIQNLMTLNAGISIFLPLRSTGREAE